MFEFISGAAVMACAVVGLFFLRFWRQSRDRLFLIFAISFWMLGVERSVLAFLKNQNEATPYVYVIRLIAFAFIVAGIIDKNRQRKRTRTETGQGILWMNKQET